MSLNDSTVLSIGRAFSVALEQEAEPLYADSLAQAMVAHLLYGRLLSSGHGPPEHIAQIGASALQRVTDHMRDHLSEELTLDDLAAVTGLSRYQLIRAFKRTLGLTPHRYLMSMRMRRAAELLTRTDYSIRHVSALCGYASPGQFATAFGRHHQVSPARYRRLMKD